MEEDPSLTMTDDERERMKVLEHERGLAFDKFYRFGRMTEPSLVLDDFLFLGNMQHATSRELLERFQISAFSSLPDSRHLTLCFRTRLERMRPTIEPNNSRSFQCYSHPNV